MPIVFVTRQIPAKGIDLLRSKGYEVDVSSKEGVLTREELLTALKTKPYDAVLSLLTDKIDKEVFEAVPTAKIFANYAVGFDNVVLADAKEKGVVITNTPGVLTDAVAEFAMALIFSTTKRLVEADDFVRAGQYTGWAPMLLLGTELKGKTLGIVGTGRIGSRVVHHAVKGFDMKVAYYDVARNEELEKNYGAVFYQTVDEVMKISDVVSVHVPLLDSTKHLINAERLALMKSTAVLVNTSRGPVIDEQALVATLKTGQIRGAGLDVFEFEPELVQGLKDLPNVVLTPHIASATEEARDAMSEIAANNIIEVLEGRTALNPVV